MSGKTVTETGEAVTRLSDSVFLFDEGLIEQARALGVLLLSRGEHLVLAESCTGGALAAVVTEVPGASQWFEAGFVVYDNKAKSRLLDVPDALLVQEGAVSAATVCALVEGCFLHSQAQVAAAISGIAGPGGGTPEKPVGTVWFGFGRRDVSPVARRQCFAGGRSSVRVQAVSYALKQLIALVQGP